MTLVPEGRSTDSRMPAVTGSVTQANTTGVRPPLATLTAAWTFGVVQGVSTSTPSARNFSAMFRAFPTSPWAFWYWKARFCPSTKPACLSPSRNPRRVSLRAGWSTIWE